MPSGVKDIQLLELKDTISQLNKTISTQNELISSLQKMLEERNAKDSEKDLLIANLQSQLAYLKNKVFGSTSEIRHDQLDGQLNLFGTPVGDEKPAEVIEPEVISVKGYTKERKPKATYDDKYNSVRSICKHFFTDIVGLSIKFFCVSLRHMSIARRVVFQELLQQRLVHGGLRRHRQHLPAKVVDIGDAAVNAGFRLHLGGSLVRLFGREDAEVFVVLKIGGVEAVQPRHLRAGDLIEHAALAEESGHPRGDGGEDHLGLAAEQNGHLHLVHVVDANPGGIVGAGKPGEEFRRAGQLHALLGDDVPLAQRDNLLADVHAVPLLEIGQDVLLHQLGEVVPHLDEPGVDGAAVVFPPVDGSRKGLFRVCAGDLIEAAHGRPPS